MTKEELLKKNAIIRAKREAEAKAKAEAEAKKQEAEKPKKKGKKPQNREFLVVESVEETAEVVEEEKKDEE